MLYSNEAPVDRCRRFLEHGNYSEVIASARPQLQNDPRDSELWWLLGRAFFGMGDFDNAILCFRQTLDIAPNSPDALCDLAEALNGKGQSNDAIACYNVAFELSPTNTRACTQLGLSMAKLDRHDVAAQFFERAALADPENPVGHFNLSVTLEKLGAIQKALEAIDKAIGAGMQSAAPFVLKGNLLRKVGALSHAADAFKLASKLEPDNELVRAEKYQTLSLLADWREQAEMETWLADTTPSGAVPPFLYLSRQDDVAKQLERSRAYARAKFPAHAPPMPPHAKAQNAPIRIGYFSTDYHDHAVMRLIGGLFAAHDRNKVEVIAYSYDLAPEDDMRRRVVHSVDAFKDVSKRSDAEIAQLAREDQIDIAVDLNGYTEKNRIGIFAHRAAPVQITWLGYPGTLGVDFIDYVIADDTTIPPEQDPFYTETVLRMPGSYQVNDDQRPVSDRVFTRQELGLPDDAIVFCGFNAVHKICPHVFSAWMEILKAVDNSVLWLICGDRQAQKNFRKSARAQDVPPDRIVFGDRMAQPDHLARQRAADLFLDTFSYNGHTTASDALWVGLPVLTRIGEQFSARVAASLLRAHGMPELVTETKRDYITKAIEIAQDSELRARLRSKAERLIDSSPLFNTRKFAQDLESLYAQVLRRRDAIGAPSGKGTPFVGGCEPCAMQSDYASRPIETGGSDAPFI